MADATTLEHGPKRKKNINPNPSRQQGELTENDIEDVFSRLPTQPWPPGTQRQIAAACGLAPRLVARIIDHLISVGRFYNQYDGVVVDFEGNIVAVDNTRADPRHVVGGVFVRHPKKHRTTDVSED